MPPLDPLRLALPRSRALQCLIVTILYAVLAWLALRAPIAADAPLAQALGGTGAAREAAVGFVRVLLWPLGGLLMLNLARDLLDGLRRALRAS